MYQMRYFFALLTLWLACWQPVSAQRRQPVLGRGVVAVWNGSAVNVTWRRLAGESEAARFNVYINGVKQNSSPLNATGTTFTSAECPSGSSLTVTAVVKNVEGEPCNPFVYRQIVMNGTTVKDAYCHVNFTEAGSPLPNDGTFATKYCWPVDLDGDGEMDYVVNRVYIAKDQNGCEGWGEDHLGGDCLEAYSAAGQHLWTVNLGINFYACGGQNDGVCVGDFDGDGRGEVMVQVCEGARFWDADAKTFGRYLYYNGVQAASNGNGTQTVSSDGTDPDIDGDGMSNYTYYNKGKNPQWYFAVIDPLAGTQRDVCAMTLPSDGDMTYTRTNKSAFRGDEYSYLSPAMGAAYLDGVTQSAVAQFQCRTADGNHHYFTYALGYANGTFGELWRFKFHDHAGLSQFHHIRIGDVDGDGRDEVMNGQCAVDHDGSLLWSSGIAHGDRFRLSDIDPDRPGQEIFAIQQDAPDMLGMILYDAANGKPIKKWYLSSVGDVGRGECMDVDPAHKGYEIWSTMPNIYDCHGNEIGTAHPYPTEGIWWDGDLAREALITSGSGNNCPAVVAKYDNGAWRRLYEMSKESGWQVAAENAVRPMFWGDIRGDWREEIILKQMAGALECGFVCFSAGDATAVNNIYCLLQDPNYYGQITNRGYYQSPNTSFYLGYDMPCPPLPPFMKANEDSEVFGLTLGNATVSPREESATVYMMPVKNQTLTLAQPLHFAAPDAELWKSQAGTLALTAPLSTGKLIVSEGEVKLSSTLNAAIDLRARGTLSGNGTVADTITFEGALHAEGCRIKPEGVLTFAKGLTLTNKVNMEIDLRGDNHIEVKGRMIVSGTPVFHIVYGGELAAGQYLLLTHENGAAVDVKKFTVEGLTGLKYSLFDDGSAIYLVIDAQRVASAGVVWSGAESGTWDYQTPNWTLAGQPTEFVAGDEVTFDERGTAFNVTLSDVFPVGKVNVDGAKNYTFSGQGGLSGDARLIKSGSGKLTLSTPKSTFTGGVTIEQGTVTVSDLADTGIASPLGSAGNLTLGKASLVVNNANCGTNRAILLNDTATIEQPAGTVALKGTISGKGTLRKTGAGQVNILHPNNSWAATILQAGTLAQGAWDAKIGATGSRLAVTGNATLSMFDNNSSSAVPVISNAIDIAKGKTLTVNAGSRCQLKGSLSGQGTYAVTFPYVRADVYTDCKTFEGTYEVRSGQLRLRQAIDLRNATLKLGAGVYAAGLNSDKSEYSYTHHLGALVSSASDCSLSTGVWTVGYLNTATTYAGTLTNAATLRKVGTGTLTLTGTSDGALTAQAGILVLSGTAHALVTVKDSGTVCGTGTAASITVNQGGTLKGGKPTGMLTGKLTLTGNLNVTAGGTLSMRLRPRNISTVGDCDAFVVAGNASLASPVFALELVSGEYAEGQTYKLFDVAGTLTLTGTPTFQPVTPAPGLLWDTSELTTTGTLGIMADPDYSGIDNVTLGTAPAQTYDLGGRKREKAATKGVYIVDGKIKIKN